MAEDKNIVTYTDRNNRLASVEIIREETTYFDDAEILIRWIKGIPETIHGVSEQRSQSLYWIIINADRTEEQQEESLMHEMLHIKRHDFDSDLPVSVIESQVDQQVEEWKRLKQRGA